jgi:hypothetical protein
MFERHRCAIPGAAKPLVPRQLKVLSMGNFEFLPITSDGIDA